MANEQLIEYIKKQLEAGYDESKIYLYLVQLGYNRDMVNDAIDNIHAEEEEKQKKAIEDKIVLPKDIDQFKNNPMPFLQHDSEVLMKRGHKFTKTYKKEIIAGAIALILLIIIINAAIWFFTRPVCGNGTIEAGETAETCCIDVGCPGEMNCEGEKKDAFCVDPICDLCEYVAANHTCQKYECCANDACANDAECINHECVEIECSDCQFADNHSCFDYICCTDSDCEDGNENTENICKNPGTLNARCTGLVPNNCTTAFDCDDGNPYTKDLCQGNPSVCVHHEIRKCLNNDGFCPPDCVFATDNDCEQCGNGIVGGTEQCDDENNDNWDRCHNDCTHNLNFTIITKDNLAPGRLSQIVYTFAPFDKISQEFSPRKLENSRNVSIALFEGTLDQHNIYIGLIIYENNGRTELFLETDSPEKYELLAEKPFEQIKNRTWKRDKKRFGVYVPYEFKMDNQYFLTFEKQSKSPSEMTYKCIFTDLETMKPTWCGSISVKYPIIEFQTKVYTSIYMTGSAWDKEMKFSDIPEIDFTIITRTDDTIMPERASAVYSDPDYGDYIPFEDISYENVRKSIRMRIGPTVARINSAGLIN
jgi:hypothetical protein